MGNTASDVTHNVKAQADGSSINNTYKLVDLKGGGELLKLVKDPLLRVNDDKLNEEIRKRVINCLYNDGEGAYVGFF